MSGVSSATARSEPIARRCGSEVMPPILPIPGPARHRKPALTIRSKLIPELLPLGTLQCVGYKVPLFLGGKDSLDNLEVVDQGSVAEDVGDRTAEAERDKPARHRGLVGMGASRF